MKLHAMFGAVACALPLAAAAGPAPEVVAYYPAWKSADFPVTETNIRAGNVSLIQYAFADICWDGEHGNPAPDGGGVSACLDADGKPSRPANGSIVLPAPQADADNLRKLNALKQSNPRLRVLLSVGGWIWSNRFSDVAATPAARQAFIASALELVRRHGLDGVDIDWEHPATGGIPCIEGKVCHRSDDKENYVRLAAELRSAFDRAGKQAAGRHYLITIAAGAHASLTDDSDASPGWMARLAAQLDWINLMTYDYRGVWDAENGQLAPLYADPADPQRDKALYADATVTRFLRAGVPAAKLVLGVPFYGYGWKQCAAGPRGDGLYQACQGAASGNDGSPTFTYRHLLEQGYLVDGKGARGFQRYWNSASQVPYLYHRDSGVFISYEDAQSVAGKVRYIRDKGLRGGMFWELSGDAQQVLGTALAPVLTEKQP
ncbi:chitinase [Janthinobacterium sp. FT14W]|uniref:glycoside hydrolase family 18 protein n=1 Tax=Janthinobacterium sp. FT14W TaxID=2654253 RepID=UPI0012651790|nr:glycoside hydrolase family 18 protein [Janthinobacterium sp. FT14W]KAB8058942.1 chitinase [Janthinobacterium sp. FT14W]